MSIMETFSEDWADEDQFVENESEEEQPEEDHSEEYHIESHGYEQNLSETDRFKDQNSRPFTLDRRMFGLASTTPLVRCQLSTSLCVDCYQFIAGSLDGTAIQRVRHFGNGSRKAAFTGKRTQGTFDVGCPFCIFFCSIVSFENPESARLELFNWNAEPWESKNRIWFQTEGPLQGQFDFIVTADEQNARDKYTLSPRPNSYLTTAWAQSELRFPAVDSASEDAYKLIGSWINTCVESHPYCKLATKALPTRLIDVRIRDTLDSVVLCLAKDLTNPRENHIRYLALSHCWGDEFPYRTDKNNYDQHRDYIRVNVLPYAFQDAISIARKLQVPYIWIDALCIIQDDDNDWICEAARMGDIYAGSLFTISQLCSLGCQSRTLGKRALRILELGGIDSENEKGTKEQKLFMRQLPWSIKREHSYGNLNRRAWTLQERLLSPAVLHYGKYQMIWECNTVQISETGEVERHDAWLRISYAPGPSGYPNPSGLTIETDNFPRPSGYSNWMMMVQEYSRRRLTYAKDRLMAIHGVAIRLSQAGGCGGRYYLGLWEDDLAFELTWYTQTTEENANDAEVYRSEHLLPSWAWASAGTRILFADGVDSVLTSSLRFALPFHGISEATHISNSDCLGAQICGRGFIQLLPTSAMKHTGSPFRNRTKNPAEASDTKWRVNLFFDKLSKPPFCWCLRLTSDDRVLNFLCLQRLQSDVSIFYRVGYGYIYRSSTAGTREELLSYEDKLFFDGEPFLTEGRIEDFTLI